MRPARVAVSLGKIFAISNVRKQRLRNDRISAAGTHGGRGHKFTADGVVLLLQAAMGNVPHGS